MLKWPKIGPFLYLNFTKFLNSTLDAGNASVSISIIAAQKQLDMSGESRNISYNKIQFG